MKRPVCVLTIHHINNADDAITISPELFRDVIKTTLDLGFKFITYTQFKDILFNRKIPDKKSVLLTFDDGYFDNYKFAYPILKEYEIPAVCFLITDIVKDYKRQNYDFKFKPQNEIDYTKDTEIFLNIDEIRQMSDLFEFDSHTATHFSCKSDNEARLRDEFSRSLTRIKELFPQKKEFGFCFPYGRFNDLSLKIARQYFDFAFSVIDGGYAGGDKFLIRRIDISNATKGREKYLARLRKKLRLYSTVFIGDLYANLRAK
ncbi:MAG: polysaccharide deacetylase family protein [Campylobacter sp.]